MRVHVTATIRQLHTTNAKFPFRILTHRAHGMFRHLSGQAKEVYRRIKAEFIVVARQGSQITRLFPVILGPG